MKHIPNILTLVRLILVIPVNYFLYYQNFYLVLILFSISAITDWIDGYLARLFQIESRFGSILDPVADKLLLLSTFIFLGWFELLPFWLIVVAVVRDIIIVTGAITYHYVFGKYHPSPLLSSKINTALQLAVVVLTLVMQLVNVPVFGVIQLILIYSVLVTSIASCSQYVIYSITRGWQ